MSNHIVRLSKSTRREAQELWNNMYDAYGFKYLPRELVSRYDEIFRSILSEILSNLIQHDMGHFRSYLTALDYASWIYWLEEANPATYDEIYHAYKLGSSVCETVIEDLSNECDEIDELSECQVEELVDRSVASTVLVVMPTVHDFDKFERAVWEDLNEANLIDLYFNMDTLVSFRPGLSRALVSDNSTMYVT